MVDRSEIPRVLRVVVFESVRVLRDTLLESVRVVLVSRASREPLASARRRSGTPELVRRTLLGVSSLRDELLRLSLLGRTLERGASLTRGTAPRDEEGVVLREGAGVEARGEDGVLLRDGAGVEERGEEGVLLREGAGEELRGVAGTEREPPLEGEPLLREPPDGATPPLPREPPEGNEPPLDPPEREPPLEPPLDPPRPPMARCASAGIANMLTNRSVSVQPVRNLSVFMFGLNSNPGRKKNRPNAERKSAAGAPRIIVRAGQAGSMAQRGQFRVPDCWQLAYFTAATSGQGGNAAIIRFP